MSATLDILLDPRMVVFLQGACSWLAAYSLRRRACANSPLVVVFLLSIAANAAALAGESACLPPAVFQAYELASCALIALAAVASRGAAFSFGALFLGLTLPLALGLGVALLPDDACSRDLWLLPVEAGAVVAVRTAFRDFGPPGVQRVALERLGWACTARMGIIVAAALRPHLAAAERLEFTLTWVGFAVWVWLCAGIALSPRSGPSAGPRAPTRGSGPPRWA